MKTNKTYNSGDNNKKKKTHTKIWAISWVWCGILISEFVTFKKHTV